MDLLEARRLALSFIETAPAERVGLADALGRVLAEDLTAGADVPSEDRSRFDGYAVRSADTSGAAPERTVFLARLPVTAAAGSVPEAELGPGECIHILTGAPVPRGADAVLPQETVLEEAGRIGVRQPAEAGSGMLERGGDIRRGECLLPAGSVFTPTRLALAAGIGETRVAVRCRPRVVVLATGDEVREIGEPPAPATTPCNNRELLSWLVRVNGGVPVVAGVAPDDPDAIAAALDGHEAEFVVSTGGIGRGDRDFLLDAWERLGVLTRYREINLMPGKNSAMGTRAGRVYFGFPGNPWAAQVLFEEMVVPCLRRRLGVRPEEKPTLRVVLGRRWTGRKGGLFQAVRGRLDLEADPPVFMPTAGGDASYLRGMGESFGYLPVEPGVTAIEAGTPVRVRLHDLSIEASALLSRSTS